MPNILEIRPIAAEDPSGGPGECWVRIQLEPGTHLRLITDPEYAACMRRARRDAYDQVITSLTEQRHEQ